MKTLFGSPFLWIGLAIAALGIGPLLFVVASDWLGFSEDSNPIGLGCLFVALFPLGLAITLAGLCSGYSDLQRERAREAGETDRSDSGDLE